MSINNINYQYNNKRDIGKKLMEISDINKIFIGVLSTKTTSTSIDGVKHSKSTWASKEYDNTCIKFYYGKHEHIEYDNSDIVVDVHENVQNILLKTIEFFKYTLQFEYDYLYRVNSSSYVNVEKLKTYLAKKPKKRFVACYLNYQKDINEFFPSGSGFILSRDLVELIVSERIEYVMQDDVSIGLFLNKLGIVYNNVPRGKYEDNTHGKFTSNASADVDCFHWYYKGNTDKFSELWKKHNG